MARLRCMPLLWLICSGLAWANLPRVVQTSGPGLPPLTVNRLKTMVDDSGTTTFGYTAAGQLQSAGGLWSSDTVTYGYNQQLRQTLTLAQPSGGNWQQDYGFDGAWRLQSLSSPAGSFGYGFGAANPASALFRTLTLPNCASITNHFDSLARLDYTALVNYWGHVLDGYSYSMDPLGLRTNITRNLGLTTNTVSVGYDNIEQITSWSGQGVSATACGSTSSSAWAMIRPGTSALRTNGGLIQTFNCDPLNQLTNVTRNSTIDRQRRHTGPRNQRHGQRPGRPELRRLHLRRHQPVAGRRQQQLHHHRGEYLRERTTNIVTAEPARFGDAAMGR